MQFGQGINLTELEYEIIALNGVIGIPKIEILQSMPDGRLLNSFNAVGESTTGGENGYGFVYSFETALSNKTIRPSATPSVFELRNPNSDIYGRVL